MTPALAAQRSRPPRVLSIAGSDSSGGAGVQADIKTITMMGGYAMTAITALTAQNTAGVQALCTMTPDFVVQQAQSCIEDIGVDAIKIGMLGSGGIAHAVADLLQDLRATSNVPIVFDPVMIATSGAALAQEDSIAAFGRLMALATLSTPNVAELATLGGAQALLQTGTVFLAKGGDAAGDVITDILHRPGKPQRKWEGSRIGGDAMHGTGCTLGSAIATALALGLELEDAIASARDFVRRAIVAAPAYGTGSRPLGHAAAHSVSPDASDRSGKTC
ncbi:bifunctional hydroxymethylpyrimidine kinase/phosphomethylpyrimidine kinase [Croceicoccus sp. F390]|uniref:hydroxymethylpyrimidine kinase n=1 Tax=Croceicoccus esteveae TaxID=3075597 RepID=A0ABU2ZK87_9SPHN|nr:bifunctional hydroxymethylpyrimidine kinase/phosphomethylpyrimidine kinase [Croceicoccus sp. F390]MDT0577013.1 bifunctional hydroxymethylpyrimidine kinase/phosphomethylpyrimidine kinase [Croceicoccus sp. F390]